MIRRVLTSVQVIPLPRTFQEYDNREFAFDDELQFSSFVYEIGLVRSIDQISIALSPSSEEKNQEMCSKGDAAVAAWNALLHKSKRLFDKDGVIDMHLFNANLIIHV
jgi:hypothetical protein